MLGVARCPWVGVQPRSRLDPGSMDLFQHLLHLGDQSTAGLWGAGGHHARSEPPETLECFGGHLYLLLCGWVFGVLMGPASLSPHWLPQTPPLGSSQALWHCQKIPSRHPAVMETQRLLLWASPTWHKGALVFVITGVAMATAHRYKPCPGDIVIGEQGAAQEPVLLYWHDLSLWLSRSLEFIHWVAFAGSLLTIEPSVHAVIIFYIYIGLCAFQVQYKLIHLIFLSHDSCLQCWVGLIPASQAFQQWNCYQTNYPSVTMRDWWLGSTPF